MIHRYLYYMMRLLKTPLLFFLGYMSIIVAAIYSIFNLIKKP
jgi:hypothetical protein